MKITTETATYLSLVAAAAADETLIGPFTTVCPECGDDTGSTFHYAVNDEDAHILVDVADCSDPVVVIGCEGYFLFEVRPDGTVAAKPDTDDALGDEATGIHAG